jgi:hypothetical protein
MEDLCCGLIMRVMLNAHPHTIQQWQQGWKLWEEGVCVL